MTAGTTNSGVGVSTFRFGESANLLASGLTYTDHTTSVSNDWNLQYPEFQLV